jgi:methylmalonyl-CoA mutase N-terminal domain/subunit
MIPAIERGFPQSEIAQASYDFQRAVESGAATIVGVNRFGGGEGPPAGLLRIDPAVEGAQAAGVRSLRAARDNARVQAALLALARAAGSGVNTMPAILDSVRVYATVGEICATLENVFGSWRESNIF